MDINISASNAVDQPLRGSVAVVTGASSGIGREIAILLADAGVKVALGARSEEKLQEVLKTIRDKGCEAIAVKTDVTKREEVKNLVKKANECLGTVDILVNNAGVWFYSKMSRLNEDEWEQMVDVNCKGTLNGIGAVLGCMMTRGRGHIINISSDAGKKTIPGLGVYVGTKFFIEGVTRALRQEVVGSGIRVTSVQPGKVAMSWKPRMDAELVEHFADELPESELLQPIDVARAVLYALTQPRHVAINEILLEPTSLPL